MNNSAVIHGIRWNLFTTVIRRILSLALLIYLASWLSQGDFGVFRTYSLILAITSVFAVIGMDSNLITDQSHIKLNLFSFAQVGLGLGVLCSLLLALSSVWLARLYHSLELGTIIRWTSLFVLVEVLRKLLRSIAQTRLMFKDLALAETWNVVFYCLLSFSVIYFYRHVWVYVVAYYLGNLVETIYLYVRLKPSPSLQLKRLLSIKWLNYSCANIKKNRAFLLNVSAIRLLNTYAGNAPILFLGTMVSAAFMGQYFFATQLIGVPVIMFTMAVGQVFYPVFAQSDTSRTIQSINSYTRLTLSLGIPLLIVYGYALKLAIPWLFTGKWDAAIPLLFSLIPYFGSSMLNDPISGIPFICRKPHWELVWNAISLFLRLLLLLWGMKYGFAFAVLLFSLGSAFMNLVFYFMSLYLLKAKLLPALASICLWSVSILALMAILHFVARGSLPILYGSICFIIYLLAVFAFAKPVYSDVRRIIR
ncbi:MAG: oligosaccharide flippase family protein [Candidatus Cloacimonetes bacterium]|nr:oligosaccharide flippase family protein [Candidatus Cloacimonadota bacterium]